MSDPSGAVFPEVEGRRSTSATGRAVVADALRPVDPVGAAAAARETSWRSGYLTHFRRLVEAGLATTEKVGRTRRCHLGAERLDDAMAWIAFYQRLWERRLDGLEAYFTLRGGAAGPAASDKSA